MPPPQTDFAWSTPITLLSASMFRNEDSNGIVGITVTDDNDKNYLFAVERNFMGPNTPAIILQSIFPNTDILVMKELQATKFWVRGGTLCRGGLMTLKQNVLKQCILNDPVAIKSIQVRRTNIPVFA